MLFQRGEGPACGVTVWRVCTSRNDDKHETVVTFVFSPQYAVCERAKI